MSDGATNATASTAGPQPLVPLSFPQELTVVLVGWFTASCSIVGSSCILYLIKQQGKLNTFRRLMLGISLFDILNSFWMLWYGLLVPRETSPRFFAIGNEATCSMLGFWVQIGGAVAFYNGMISWHHLLTIRYGLSPQQIAQKYEPYMHAVAISFPLVTAIIGVSLGVFHETYTGTGCWVADYPEGCDGNPDLDCLSMEFGFAFAGVPVLLIFIMIVVNMFRISRHVRRTYKRGARRSSNATLQSNRVDQVATQAYLFVLVYFLSFFFQFVVQISEATTAAGAWNEQSIFPYIVLNQIFFPLQGFFNFFIYIRPRYISIRRQNLDNSRWWAFRQTLTQGRFQDLQSSSRLPASRMSRFWSDKSAFFLPNRRPKRSSSDTPPSKVAPEPRFLDDQSNDDNFPAGVSLDSASLGWETSDDPNDFEASSAAKDLDVSLGATGSVKSELPIELSPDAEATWVEPMPEVEDISDDVGSK